jgi:hypothetical protein
MAQRRTIETTTERNGPNLLRSHQLETNVVYRHTGIEWIAIERGSQMPRRNRDEDYGREGDKRRYSSDYSRSTLDKAGRQV